MRDCRILLVPLILTLVLAGRPAHACMTMAPLELVDVKYADVVVEGRISDYKVDNPDFLSGYARFTILVDEVLVGSAPQTLTVTWDNSTFAEPGTMSAGPFVIALRDPRSGMPPLRGPSATSLPNPEPANLTVLQAPCSIAFIFPSESAEASAIRRLVHH